MLFRSVARTIAAGNGYAAGRDVEAVRYRIRGGSDDWMYAAENLAHPILSMTAEVGDINDGFWPSRARIIPLAIENLPANFTVLWSAGANLKPFATFATTGEQEEKTRLGIEVRNIGADSSLLPATLTVRALEPRIRIEDSVRTLPKLAPGASQTYLFAVSSDQTIDNGRIVSLETIINQENVPRRDTARLQIGNPDIELLFNGTGQGWRLNGWDVVEDILSDTAVLTDSPGNTYRQKFGFISGTRSISRSAVRSSRYAGILRALVHRSQL